MEEERHDMEVYGCEGPEGKATQAVQYLSVFFPDIGTITLTYETNKYEYAPELNRTGPVVSIDFPVDKVRVIDARGNDRSIT